MAHEAPPLTYDANFDGYGYFDPRAFWNKVVDMNRDPQTPTLPPTGSNPTEITRNSGYQPILFLSSLHAK